MIHRLQNPFRGFLEPFRRVHEVKTILIVIKLRHFLCHCAEFALMVQKTRKLTAAGAFVQIKAPAPRSAVATVFTLHHNAVGEMPVSFKNDDAVKIINYIKKSTLEDRCF